MTTGSAGRRLALAGGLIATALIVAACNSSTPGVANPVGNGGSGQTAASSPPTTTGNGLPVNQACSLLSSTQLEQLGVSSPPSQEMVGTAHSCDFNSAGFAMGVAIRTDVGLDGFTSAGGTVHDTTIGRHQAKQEVDNTGSCVIGIGVSASSRVDIVATGDGTTDPCPTALKLAGMVEQKLP